MYYSVNAWKFLIFCIPHWLKWRISNTFQYTVMHSSTTFVCWNLARMHANCFYLHFISTLKSWFCPKSAIIIPHRVFSLSNTPIFFINFFQSCDINVDTACIPICATKCIGIYSKHLTALWVNDVQSSAKQISACSFYEIIPTDSNREQMCTRSTCLSVTFHMDKGHFKWHSWLKSTCEVQYSVHAMKHNLCGLTLLTYTVKYTMPSYEYY